MFGAAHAAHILRRSLQSAARAGQIDHVRAVAATLVIDLTNRHVGSPHEVRHTVHQIDFVPCGQGGVALFPAARTPNVRHAPGTEEDHACNDEC